MRKWWGAFSCFPFNEPLGPSSQGIIMNITLIHSTWNDINSRLYVQGLYIHSNTGLETTKLDLPTNTTSSQLHKCKWPFYMVIMSRLHSLISRPEWILYIKQGALINVAHTACTKSNSTLNTYKWSFIPVTVESFGKLQCTNFSRRRTKKKTKR